MSHTIELTPAVLRALAEGVCRLNDGDTDDGHKADEVKATLKGLGYVLTGYDFVHEDWILVVAHLHHNGADKDNLTVEQETVVRLRGDGISVGSDRTKDWSHIRDSSEDAVKSMARKIRAFTEDNHAPL